MPKENKNKAPLSETETPKNTGGALWVALIMGGLLALIFIGDYVKSRH